MSAATVAAIHDRSRPFMLAGTAVDITIPFTGEPEVFQNSAHNLYVDAATGPRIQ